MVDPLVLARAAEYLAAMLLTGLATFPVFALSGHEGSAMARRMASPLLVLALLGLVASALQMALMLAALTGTTLAEIDPSEARTILRGSQLGAVYALQLAALGFTAALSLRGLRGKAGALAIVAAGAAALAAQIWTGHGGAEEGTAGLVLAGVSVFHLLAGAGWLGALSGFLWLVGMPGRPAPLGDDAVYKALSRFAGVGSLAVAILLLTGIAKIAFAADASPGVLLARPYWQWLAIKLVLFGMMCGLAAANRWIFTPALGRAIADGSASCARRNLRLSIAAEGLLGFGVIAIVAWIGTVDPGPA